MTTAAIGIGSNLGNPARNVAAGIAALRELGRVVARSRFYRSRPWGVSEQPAFVNAAVLLETDLDAHALLAALKALESRLGRRPTYRWGPRVIDFDILYFGEERIDEPELHVPHARLRERAFALAPLAEIDPRYVPAYAALPAAERRGTRALRAKP